MTRTKGIAILCVALSTLVACSAGTTVVARDISPAGAVVPGSSQTAPVLSKGGVRNENLGKAPSGLAAGNGELTGQTAVVTGDKDVAPVAKVLKTFASEFKKAMLKLGFIGRAQVATKEIEQLADLPPREVLQAQLLGLFLSPATKLVRLFNEPASALARLLKAKSEKEGQPAETPAT